MTKRFTGMTDINGKKVYEGDIVTVPRTDKPHSKTKKEVRLKATVIYVPYDETKKTVNGWCCSEPPHWSLKYHDEELSDEYGCADWDEFYGMEKQ